jgi:hypothetical protein
MRTFSKLFAVAALLALSTPNAEAQECSAKVKAAFKGQLIVTDQQLDLGGEAADVIAAVKKKNLTVIKSEEIEDTPTWGFYFTAFMSRSPGAKSISLDFFTDDGERRYVANKKLDGIDPSITMIQHNVMITEDDGLNIGKRYIVKLTSTVGGKEVVLATTKLSTK